MRNTLRAALPALAVLVAVALCLLPDGRGRVDDRPIAVSEVAAGGESVAAPAAAPVIVIGSKRFVAQLTDMAVNAKSYAGKTVRLEGFILLLDGSPRRFAVARIFSCCGPDGYPVGLPCAYAGETPPEGGWVEAEGTFRIDDRDVPYLEVTKLTEKAIPLKRNVFS